jgi:mRNA-degrading endonuclease RelE of RelBE toxin-antitoxin system
MNFISISAFDKDLKKLQKKYSSLNDDIENLKTILRLYPKSRPPFSFTIPGLGLKQPILKFKKIACQSLKGKGNNSGLRLIYTYNEETDTITFIEIYHKNQKELEDRERINHLFK